MSLLANASSPIAGYTSPASFGQALMAWVSWRALSSGRLLLAADALEEPLMIAALKREVREANSSSSSAASCSTRSERQWNRPRPGPGRHKAERRALW